jgi:putative ABC transport system permease protein
VEQVNETTPMRDTDVARVRSVDAVAWAYPFYSGFQRVRMENGSFKLVQLVGLDAGTLAGAPKRMIAGNFEDLRQPNAVVIDDLAIRRISPKDRKLTVGDSFEINDIEARIVGICEADNNFTVSPYVYTTYERALQYAPPQRKMLSAVLAAPRAGLTARQAAAEVEKETRLRAFVNEGFTLDPELGAREFSTATIRWYFKNTGIPISFGITMVIGFIVGISIACQTFYSFVADNQRHLGSLKAMGVGNAKLCGMLLIQAVTVGCIGYGLGMLMTAGFAMGAMKNEEPPFFLPWQAPVFSFVAVIGICCLAALLGMIRVARLEPAMVFRS